MIDTVHLMNAAMAVTGTQTQLEHLRGVTVTLAGTLPSPGLRINVSCANYGHFIDVCDRLFDWAAIELLVDEESATGKAHGTPINVYVVEEVAA